MPSIKRSGAGGTDTRAGVRVPLVPFVALFAEHTFRLSPHTFEDGTNKDKFTLRTNQIVGGIALHF